MKKEIFEKINDADILTEAELKTLTESDPGFIANMYGGPPPRDKNMNRVIAGLKAHNDMLTPNTQHSNNGVNPRYIKALEMQIVECNKHIKELHNRYASLIKSHNQALNRINELSRRFDNR